jgi:uncharacterized GH25 family protein
LKGLQRVRAISAALIYGAFHAHSATAHDFWIQPQSYRLQPGISTPVTLQVGHGPLRQRSPIALRRITRFEAITPQGARQDLRSNLHPGEPAEDAELRLDRRGVYVLVLETDDHAQSHLPASRFNDHLKAEGLTLGLEQRIQTGRMEAEGSESYRRQAKSIVQVGSVDGTSQDQVVEPVGLALEIVPEVSPYTRPRSASLPVRVIWEGNPLAGALVKLTDLEQDSEPLETRLSDLAGRAVFPMPVRGTWLLNVVWTKPLPGARDTDFETVFSSLTFGFSGAAE